MNDVTFNLRTPIKHGTEEIGVLTVKAPTLKTIRKIGLPFRFGVVAGSEFEIDAERLARYLSELCALPPSTIDQISATDFVGLTQVFSGFFGQSPA